MSLERAGETLFGESGSVSLRRKVGPRFVSITAEQIPEGSFVRIYSLIADGEEVLTNVLFDGDALPAHTPTPTPIPPTPTPTSTPRPTPRPALPSLVGFSPLLAQAASNLPAKYDFVRDGLTTEERQILDWADSRLFSNQNFLDSKWGPDNWANYEHPREWPKRILQPLVDKHGFDPEETLSPTELRLRSAQAILLLMKEIDIQKRSNGRHVVSWQVDSLDSVLDGLGIYPDLCVHCYGKTGYDTNQGLINDNYIPLVYQDGHIHREMLKHFAYFAKADGLGVLVRSLMVNQPEDFELLYKRKFLASPRTGASFGHENVSFMSQIRLPDGTLESYPTVAFRMAGHATTEQQAVEEVFDYVRFRLKHFTGNTEEGWFPLYQPYTVTPFSPEPGWILYVGEAGSGSVSGLVAGTLRALGIKAEENNERGGRFYITGAVEINGETFYHNGNHFFGDIGDVCIFFLEEEFYGPETEGEKFSPLDQSVNEACQVLLEKESPAQPFVSERPSPDRKVLIALYQATDGPNWSRNDHWLSDRPIDEWYGVTTDVGRVTHLHLYANGLSGVFPPEIGDLNFLKELHLSFNGLHGPLPSELGNLEKLEKLYLGQNQYIGSLGWKKPRVNIPHELGKLRQLKELDLQGTSLTGCVPASLKEQLDTKGVPYSVRPGKPFCEQ